MVYMMLSRTIIEMLIICVLGEKPSDVAADVLLYLYENGPVVGTREIIRRVGRWPNAVIQTLRALEEVGLVRVHIDGRKPGPGRKPRVYTVDHQMLARALEECGAHLLRASAELRGTRNVELRRRYQFQFEY